MNKDHKDPYKLDLTKPRLASYEQKWRRHQDTVYWVDIQLAQRKGLQFYQTRCSAIILHDTLPAYCISNFLWCNLEKSYTSTTDDFFQRKLDERIGFRSRWKQQRYQRIQPKPKTQLSRTMRPVGGLESTHCCVSMPIKKLKKKIKQEQWDPWRWMSSTLTSEYQDWHRQLWKKQNISEFKSLSKRSKVIFIEKHFKPSCSRITSTTHSEAVRRRWPAIWAM